MPSWVSRTLLAIILILVVLPAIPHKPLDIPGERKWGEAGLKTSDAVLYEKIVADVEGGQGYYQAAVAEHRAFHYPVAPAPVFRMPTLAWLLTRPDLKASGATPP